MLPPWRHANKKINPSKLRDVQLLLLLFVSQFHGLDNLYCRYALSFGNDWYIIHVSSAHHNASIHNMSLSHSYILIPIC